MYFISKKIYSGYLYDGKKPLQHVKIIEQATDNFTYTDHKGSFNLKRLNVDKINDLIIKSADKKVDTIKILRGSCPESQLRYLFLNKIPDTVDIEKERLFKKQSNPNGKIVFIQKFKIPEKVFFLK